MSPIAEGSYSRRETVTEAADFSLIRAYGGDNGAPVLLKVLRANRATSADLARFKHQYERIALLTSPYLV
jgi:hypothetical protein